MEMRPYSVVDDEDELKDLLQEAISNGEGRLTPYYLILELERNGFVLMRKV